MQKNRKEKHAGKNRPQWYVVLLMVLLCLMAGCQKEMELDDRSELGKPGRESDTHENLSLEGKTILKAPDIFIMNGKAGYVSEWRSIRDVVVMIENREQWDKLWDSGEVWNSNGVPEYRVPFLGNSLAALCDPQEYPLEKYTYFFSYDEVSSGGYSHNADKVILDDNFIYFGLDESSHGPESDYVTDVMDGFCYFAAIPKELLAEKELRNVITPGGEAYLDGKLSSGEVSAWYYADNVADEKLSEKYGEQLYVIHSREEYEAFLAKAGDAKIKRNDMFSLKIDFDKTVLACTFLKISEKKASLFFEDYGYKVLKDGRIRIYYSCSEESMGDAHCTSMLCRFLPKMMYEQELEEARMAAGEDQGENIRQYPREASITHQGYTEKDGEYALLFSVTDLSGEELEIELPVEVSNAVLGATWISENLLGVETHVNPSTSIYYVYDVETRSVQRSYEGLSFAVLPGTDHIMYEENIPHFSHESTRHSYYVDDKLSYTEQWPDYRLGTPVFSEDLTLVAFMAYYTDDELISDGKMHNPELHICDFSMSNFSMKLNSMMPILPQDGFEGAFFDEENELRVILNGVTYADHGGGLCLYRE